MTEIWESELAEEAVTDLAFEYLEGDFGDGHHKIFMQKMLEVINTGTYKGFCPGPVKTGKYNGN